MAARPRMLDLDGLRAFAVLAVLVQHYWAVDGLVGGIGVRLFFVISGYLITGILLERRSEVEAGLASGMRVVRRFYLRRALRIFPAYYALLLLALLLNMENIRSVAWWHAAHLSNVLFSIRDAFVPGYTAHYWSLSIEEQFYLVWPFLVLFVARPLLVPLIAAITISGVAYRTWALTVHPEALATYYLTPAAFDALGSGALLAVFRGSATADRVLTLLAVLASAIGLPLAVAYYSGVLGEAHWVGMGLLAILNAPMAWLVHRASKGFGGLPGAVLSAPPIVYLGRISFGIYLYHLFVLEITWRVLDRVAGMALPPHGPGLLLLCGALTIAVAAASWHFLEQPFNGMRSAGVFVSRAC